MTLHTTRGKPQDVNNHFPENVIETILTNQNQITLLLESQNKLIEKLLENG
jgi:hypothetical protein